MNVISQALKNILEWIFNLLGNYGWSVIIFTLLIRLVILPLEIKSKRGMRAMSAIQPKMQALQKKYANDKEKLNQKMSELYKKEKVSPMSGCLPMLIQLPVLFCMFTAMRVVANEETVKMVVEWATQFANGGYEALTAWIAGGADASSSVIMTWEQAAAQGLDTSFSPVFQSFLWIKNLYQPDSFSSTIMPTLDSLVGVGAVNGTYLTEEHLAIAKAFLSSDVYQNLSAMMGANDFKTISIPILITTWKLNIPLTWDALIHSANGLFILPLLAAVSQFLYTKLTPQQTGGTEQQNSTNNFMKWFFPLFSLFICAGYTAAFALYWVFVNVIMIVQQYVLNWYFDRADKKKLNSEEALKP